MMSMKDLEDALFDYIKGSSKDPTKIVKLLNEELSKYALDYAHYKTSYPKLLQVLNNCDSKVVISILNSILLNRLPIKMNIVKSDLFHSKEPLSDEENTKLFPYAQNLCMKALEMHQSNPPFSQVNLPPLTEEDKKGLLKLFYDMVNIVTDKKIPDNEIDAVIAFFSIIRSITEQLSNKELFYIYCVQLSDILTNSYKFELGNYIFNLILEKSFEDNLKEYGFFLNTRWCSLNRFPDAFINAIVCLNIIQKKNEVHEYLISIFLKDLFRLNIGIASTQGVKHLYEYISENLELDLYENLNFQRDYYFSRLSSYTNDSLEIFKIVDENIEYIKENGAKIASGYFALICNICRMFPSDNNANKLRQYFPVFKELIGEQDFNRIKAFSDIPSNESAKELKHLLFDFMKNLKGITDPKEIDYLIRSHLALSFRLFDCFLENKDIDDFLLSMIIKTDLSLFKITHPEYFEKTILSDNFQNAYQIYFVSSVQLKKDQSIWWLLDDGENIYVISYKDRRFSELVVKEDNDLLKVNSWINNFNMLTVKERRKRYANNKEKTQQILSIYGLSDCIPKLKISYEDEIILIKDINLAAFPHNFMMDENGSLVSLRKPVINVLSTEWFAASINTRLINLSTSIYLPIEDKDPTILDVKRRLENSIKKYKINEVNKRIPDEPLSSEINIIVAHGNKQISEFYSFDIGDNYTVVNLQPIIGKGKIAVLFICNAGVQGIANYGHVSSSFVRYFFLNGYQAVIAPFWELYSDIPEVWLPTFLESLEAKMSVSEAFHYANMKVFESNNDPIDWSCLHLYGNPNLSLA